MTERISALSAVASVAIDPNSQKVMEQDLPALVRSGGNRVADALQHLSDKTKQQLNNTFGNIEQHYSTMLDKLAQRLAKGNFSLNTESTLRGIKEIADEIGNLGLSLTASKLLDLGSQLRLPKAIEQVKELKQEARDAFQEFSSQATSYQKWLQVFANRPDKQGLSSPMAGMTKFFAETHGEFNQKRMLSQEQAYEDAYHAYSAQQQKASAADELARYRTALQQGSMLNDPGIIADSPRNNRTSASNMAIAARKMQELEKEALEKQNYLASLAIKANANPYSGSGSLSYGQGSPAAHTAWIISQVRAQGAADRSPIEEWNNRRKSSFFSRLGAQDDGDEYQPYYAAGRFGQAFQGFSKSRAHAVRFSTQQVGFGIDDAIQSYHYGGAAASIRAASNNATALASTLIANPVTAAGTVVAISIATAALPVILRRFGLDKAFQQSTAYEQRTLLRSSPEDYFQQKRTAEIGTRISEDQASKLAGIALSSRLLQSRFVKQGNTSFINDTTENLFSSLEMSANQSEERQRLVRANRRIENQTNYFGTTKWLSATEARAVESNLEKIAKIDDEERRRKIDQANNRAALQQAKRERQDVLAFAGTTALQDYDTEMAMKRGGLSKEEYFGRLEQRAARRLQMIGPGLQAEKVRARLQVQLDLEEAKADPFLGMNIDLARLESMKEHNSFFQTYGPERTKLAQARLDRRQAGLSLQQDFISKRIDAEEFQYRKRTQATFFDRQEKLGAIADRREFEDLVLDANPEKNPLTRLLTTTQRRLEDLANNEKLTPEQRLEMSNAILAGTETRRRDTLRPSGTRRFSTGAGIDVNSQEDFELRARMTGTFQWEKKQDVMAKNQEEANRLLQQLLNQLKIDAERLGRK
jgi:hypothetical protein